MPDNPNTTPIVSPLLLLLKSRKFLLTFVGIVLDILIVFLPPDTAPRILAMRAELLIGVTTLIGVLIGGITVEDTAKTVGAAKVEVEVVRAEATMAAASAAASAPTSTTSPENG